MNMFTDVMKRQESQLGDEHYSNESMAILELQITKLEIKNEPDGWRRHKSQSI